MITWRVDADSDVARRHHDELFAWVKAHDIDPKQCTYVEVVDDATVRAKLHTRIEDEATVAATRRPGFVFEWVELALKSPPPAVA